MRNDNWTFFRTFLKSPLVVASVIPSSSFLERRVIRRADIDGARVVAELGTGTGGITRALLDAMEDNARLVAFERTAEFADLVRRIDDPRLEIVEGCASSVARELSARGCPPADVVVSGIPFSTLPKPVAREIVAAVHDALAPGGRFVAYQFADAVADYFQPVMGAPDTELELRNVPPMRVYTWRKALDYCVHETPQRSAAATNGR